MLLPHSSVNPEDPLVYDFRNMLHILFKHLRPKGEVTPAQFMVAEFLQHGWAMYDPDYVQTTGRLDFVSAFRGFGKSEILAAYACWLLYRNPCDEKILVVSATHTKAEKFVKQVKELILTCPELAKLRPAAYQRNTKLLFDVFGASNTQSPSCQSRSITSQITGERASTIIADDIEIPDNSRTAEKRELLAAQTLEFHNISYPRDPSRNYFGGDIVLLGTPQSSQSIYNVLITERGYKAWVYPARYPSIAESAHYLRILKSGETIDILAPEVRKHIEQFPEDIGKPTDIRFDNVTLIQRENQGLANWRLQYQLDTTMSDEQRYPLKCRDLIVFPCHPDRAPRTIHWGPDSEKRNYRRDIPCAGHLGDLWLGPLFVSDQSDWAPYDVKILYIDTSGRGENETAWWVLGSLNGTLYGLYNNAMTGSEARRLAQEKAHNFSGPHDIDSYDIRMEMIAKDAKIWKVGKIIIETNFGDGLWMKTFQPVLAKVFAQKQTKDGVGCDCEEIRVGVKGKEERICDTLEPVMLNHRLVISETSARDEEAMYQLTHITREKGCLLQDDRVDALAGGVQWLMDALAQEQKSAAQEQRDELERRCLEAFLTNVQSPPSRGGLKISRSRWGFGEVSDYDQWEESEVISRMIGMN